MTTLEERETAAVASAGGLRRAAARSASVAGVTNIGVQVLFFAVYLVLARLTTPAVFGTFAAASILLGLGEMFTESGMTSALLQRRDRVDAAAATALMSTFVGGLALALLALALSPLVGLYFRSREIGLAAAVLSGYLVINGVTAVPATVLQRRFSLRRWAVEPVVGAVFGVVSGVGLVAGLGVWGLVIGWYASGVTRAAGYWVGAQWLPDMRLVSWEMWRDLGRFARHILASQLLLEIQRVATTALIGRRLGPRDLGEFRFAWRLVSQAAAPVLAANAYTIQPTFARLSEDQARVRDAVLSAFRVVSLIAFPIGAVFVPLGNTFAVVMFGNAWRGSGTIMMALAGMGIALAMESVPSEIFKARGRPDLLPRMHVLWSATSIGLMFALLPFGALGVAFAWSASTGLVALYALSRVPHVVPVRLREIVRAILPPLLSAAGSAVALFAIDRVVFGGRPEADLATLGKLAFEIVIGATIYVSAMALLARGTLVETFATLRTMSRRRRHAEATP